MDVELEQAVRETEQRAEELDRRLHRELAPLGLSGATAFRVDDGLATGATMIAAARWARGRRAARS